MSLRVALTHVYAWPEVRRGAERYLHELGSALVDAGHEVSILSTAAAAGRADVLGVPVRYLRRRHVARRRFGAQADEVAFAGAALAALRGGRGLDVWHAMGTADAAAAALAGRVGRHRSVYTDHGFPNRASRRRRPDRRLHDLVVARVDRYVCVSEAAGRFLRDGYGREPDVLSGGVDTRRFVPAEARAPRPTLLFVADAGEERKNLPLLLEAVATLAATDVPDVELWIAGPGDQAAAVAAAPARARDASRCLGSIEPAGLVDLYGRAWVTVLPARAEAFGLVLVESLACGTPVVGLDHGGPPEIVAPGVGATSAEEPGALADACRAALHLAGEADTVERCRAASMRWDWRTGIVPRLERVYAA